MASLYPPLARGEDEVVPLWILNQISVHGQYRDDLLIVSESF